MGKLSQLLVIAMLAAGATAAEPDRLDLSGSWHVRLDRANEGENRQWAGQALEPVLDIRLPGSVQAQGVGDDVSVNTRWVGQIVDGSWYTSPEFAPYRVSGNIKIPFWLQPSKHYIGAVWYQREIDIPANWRGKRLRLLLERVHITSKVWLDGKETGTGESLSTPHVFDLGRLSSGKHTLTILVNNNTIPNIGENSHCVSDHMQTAWNGIIGRVELIATPDTWLDGVEVFPDVSGRQVRVTWRLAGQPAEGTVVLTVFSPDGTRYSAAGKATAGGVIIPLGNKIATWDEFSPMLHRIEVTLTMPDGGTHTVTSRFGLVDYRIDGKHFLVNGRPTIFRGTLDCACYPLTGYPSTDVAYWKKEIAVIKAHGFNHIRFHSWCPPEAAFIAADELGCYLQIEHAWTAPAMAGDYIMREAEGVVRAFGNHPSFAMHTYGNEPTGGEAWMENFTAHFRERDPRRFHTSSAGREALKNDQYALPQGADIRVNPWAAGLSSGINSQIPSTATDFGTKTKSLDRPIIAHESGQWCVYPDFDEIKQYTGFLKAKNFEVFRDILDKHQMGDQARDFLMASGRLQTLCYKYEIEKLLRTPDIGGYQLLGLNDFPGQGTALVGAVNPFWETKPYTTATEYASFAGPSVPLARLSKFVFKTDEILTADIDISHYAAAPLIAAVPEWKLIAATGKTVRSGKLPARDIPVGQSALGKIEIPMSGLDAPTQLKFSIGIAGHPIGNHWDIWVYPATTPHPAPGAIVISRNPAEAVEQAKAGGSVLLLPPAAVIVDPDGPKVVSGFSTIFWNTAWTRRQPPTTMGILCDPRHAVFAGFPTEYHSNYQWWYLLRLTKKPLSLEGQDPRLRPLVQVIDDWFTARRLGLVVEARCGAGKLLISAVDVESAAPDDIVAAQFRASLLAYMGSRAFAPGHELDSAAIGKIVRLVPLPQHFQADSAAPGYPAGNVADNNPDTIWHSEWAGDVPGYPHELRFEFKQPVTVTGFSLLPRQDNANGWIKDAEFLISGDGMTWTSVATATLADNREWKMVSIAPVRARFIKLRALTPHNPKEKFASLAELSVDIKNGTL